ncbi:MAG: hypothetical protein HYZ25_17680 [Chloroflexi bacterium]|nr:hypothetical protein [Chloroflexota bacterium]
MKHLLNLTKFTLAILVPMAVFLAISEIFKIHLEPFTLFLSNLTVIFSMEIITVQLRRESYWSVISRSRKDIVVFIIGLILIGILVSFPQYYGIKTWWIRISFLVVGYLLGFGCMKLFGSRAMNAVLWGANKEVATDI